MSGDYRCDVCGAWSLSKVFTARCVRCEERSRELGGEVRSGGKLIGYTRDSIGRVVVEEGAPRTAEAEKMIRTHLAWLRLAGRTESR